MRVSELTGDLLDHWVMRAEEKRLAETKGCTVQRLGFNPKYSSSWSIGGPVIDRERISVVSDHKPQWLAAMPDDRLGDWGQWTRTSIGSTALVAAMRAYVASKFGDDVPDEPAA